MKYILGVDVGGTKIAAGLVDGRNKVSNIKVLPTSQSSLLDELTALIGTYRGFSGIGIGMPGPVLADGTVTRLGNIPQFKTLNLKKFLERKFKVPVSVLNDAKAFALAEAVLGPGKSHRSVVGVVLGTGIGAGFILNKEVYLGFNSLAGEIGHFEMPDGEFFEKEVKTAGKFKNAKQAKNYLRSLASFIVRSFDPEIIVVGGGWGSLSGMQKELAAAVRTLRKFPVKTRVAISKIKYSGIIGATLPLKK